MEANNPKEVNTSKRKNEAVRSVVSRALGDPSLQAGGSWFGVAAEPWEELPVVPGPHPESVSSLSSQDLGHTQPHSPIFHLPFSSLRRQNGGRTLAWPWVVVCPGLALPLLTQIG